MTLKKYALTLVDAEMGHFIAKKSKKMTPLPGVIDCMVSYAHYLLIKLKLT
jgi:hypothetical protein